MNHCTNTPYKMAFKILSKTLLLTVLVSCGALAIAAEVDYAQGHGALEIFDGEGMAATPLWVRIWLALMVSCFAVGLYFSWKNPLARWAVGGFLASATSGAYVFSLLNLPFLSGSIAIMHIICWSPALVMLLVKRPFLDASENRAFRIWAGTMTAFIVFSFVFDIRDAIIYISHVAGAA